MMIPLIQMFQKGIFFLVAALVFFYSATVHASTLHSDFYGYFSTLLVFSEIICCFSLLGFLSYNLFVDLKNIIAARKLKPKKTNKESGQKTDVSQIIEKAIRWLISLAIPLCLVLIPILGISIHDGESGISFFDYIFFKNRDMWASFETQRFFFSPFSMMIGVSLGLLIPTLSVALNVVFFRIGLSFLREKLLDGTSQENDIGFLRVFRVGMSFFESLPFFIPLIGVRLYFTNSVNIQATLDTYADSIDLFRPFYATTGFHIGIFFTALFLGLQLGASLSNWIDKEEEISHSSIYGRLAFLNKRPLSRQVIRERLWLESREKFIEKILIGLSVLFLTETICGLVIDSFVLTGSTKSIQIAPLYPSLGSILFVKKFQEGMGDISAVHLSILLALLIIPMIIASIPKVVRLSYIKNDTLYIPTGKPWTEGAKKDEIWTPHTLGINFVLGESGTGKSTYLVALRNGEPGNSIPVPQDPDFCLPKDMTAKEVVHSILNEKGKELLKEYLGTKRLNDKRLRVSCGFEQTEDFAITPLFRLSRGERQRFVFALSWAALMSRDCERYLVLMDEFTSAQDSTRANSMWKLIKENLDALSKKSNKVQTHLFVATHDPTTLKRWVENKPDEFSAAYNRTLWFHRRTSEEKKKGDTPAVLLDFSHYTSLSGGFLDERSNQEEGSVTTHVIENLQDFKEKLERIHVYEDKGERVKDFGSAPESKKMLLSSRIPKKGLFMGPRILKHAEPVKSVGIIKNSLTILSGKSGCGKSTLLRHIINHKRCTIGWIPQDPGRVFPRNMQVVEAILMNFKKLDETDKQSVQEYFPDLDIWGQTVHSLSEGQRQRVSIMRELLRMKEGKSVLLLDEPFGSLDPNNHIEWMKKILEWKDETQNRAILMISHTQEIEKGLSASHSKGNPIQTWEIQID